MNIGIVGTRQRDGKGDLELVRIKLLEIYKPGDNIISGGCKQGGDRFSEILANELQLDFEWCTSEEIFAQSSSCTKAFKGFIRIHVPDENRLDAKLLAKNRRAAYAVINYARNTLIAQDSDKLIACVAPDRKGGTEDTIKKFVKLHGKDNLIIV